MSDTIDAVVLWVDGNDTRHIRKRLQYLDNINKTTLPYANLDGRFFEAGEVRYCIYSIRKYAGWIRNIYLVTDDQRPEWLTDELMQELNVFLVDHKIIFRDHTEYLPTFNTLSILNMLWKIPGLADKYIIFNDDVFLIDYSAPEDFFIGDQVVLRGRWHSMKDPLYRKLYRSLKYILKTGKLTNIPFNIMDGFTNGAKLTGFRDKYFETYHSPYPSRRDIEEKFYNENPVLLNQNIRYRFRNKLQFGPTVVFSHIILKNDKAIIQGKNDSELIIPRPGGLKDHRPRFDNLSRNRKKFLCFQDLFYLEKENPPEFGEVIEFLDKFIMS